MSAALAVAPPELLREALVSWYRANARDLPWRRAVDPWWTLLSELMLQQTRVDTVIPYFHRFVARWPDVFAFAAAAEDDVLAAWAGLGYYRRARNLHAAAKAAAARGGIPGDLDGLLGLPGVGPYTAGAIAAIAFGLPTAAVDGNVERVLSRVDGSELDPSSKAGKAALRARATALSAPGLASEVVQGLMELGATVCTPRNPRCGACPWASACRGRAAPERLPIRPARKAPAEVRGAAGLLWLGGRLVMGRRPEGLLGGMWEPVMIEGAEAPEALVRRAFAERAGVDVEVAGAGVEVVHVFTHRRLILTVFEVRAVTDPDRLRLRGDGSYTELALLDPDDRTVPFSRLAEKVVAAGRPTSAPRRGGAQRAARLAAEPELPWPGERQT